MSVWESILNLLLMFPRWYWAKVKEYQEEDNRLGIVKMTVFALFVTVLSILAFLAFIYLCYLFAVYHPLIASAIIFVVMVYLFALFKPEPAKKEDTTNYDAEWEAYYEACDRAYITARSIMYQVLRSCAMELGGNMPTFINQIEMPEEHYVVTDNFCLFQFKLDKTDIHEAVTENILSEYKDQLQYCIHSKIKNCEFPTLHIQDYVDTHGNVYDGFVVHNVEDFGKYLHFYVVFVTSEYTDYLAQAKAEANATSSSNNSISESWKK